MSYFKLKTNISSASNTSPYQYVLSQDLKYLIIYNDSFYTLVSLTSRTILFSNECTQNMRIRSVRFEDGLIIAQFQVGSTYKLQARELKNSLSFYELEISEEMTACVRAKVQVGTEELNGLFYGTASGKLRLWDFNKSGNVADIKIKTDGISKIGKIRKLILYLANGQPYLVIVDNDHVLLCAMLNQFEIVGAFTYKGLTFVDSFLVFDGDNEAIAVIGHKNKELSLVRIDISSLMGNKNNSNIQTDVKELGSGYDETVNVSLVKDNFKPNKFYKPVGDTIVVSYKKDSSSIGIRFFFLREGSILEHTYIPSLRIKELISGPVLNIVGFSIPPQNTNVTERKYNIYIIANNGRNMIFDQIDVSGQENIDKELNQEKYKIFYKDFQLTPMGIEFIQNRGLHTKRRELVEGKINFADLKLGFLEYLIDNNKQQIIIDIIMNKVQDYDDQTFAFLELERCERGINEIFQLRRAEVFITDFNLDLVSIRKYQQFLQNTLQIYDAIYDRKLDEALKNSQALKISKINAQEEAILNFFDEQRAIVQQEFEYIKILIFSHTTRLADLYESNFDRIEKRWDEHRRLYKEIFANKDNDLVNKYEFFIDLYFSTQDFEYPVRLPKLLEWIRRETSGANKKFLIYYIIKKEFETLASQPNLTQPHDITKEICDALYKSFLEEFKLSDREIAHISGLARLDLLIHYVKVLRDYEGKFDHLAKSEALLKVAKEACFYLSGYELPDDEWKEFALNAFCQYECYDELMIFVRSGYINWSNPHFARKLIIILVKNKKILQAYNFVSALARWDEGQEKLNESFKTQFFAFIELVIAENQVDQLFLTAMKEHEKFLLRSYFEENSEYYKYYLLYLLKENQVIEAVEFANKNPAVLKTDKTILKFLAAKVNELPDIIRETVKEKNPILREAPSTRDSMVEEKELQAMMKEESRRIRAEKLYEYTSNRDLKDFPVDKLKEELKHQGENQERLGLLLYNEDEVQTEPHDFTQGISMSKRMCF